MRMCPAGILWYAWCPRECRTFCNEYEIAVSLLTPLCCCWAIFNFLNWYRQPSDFHLSWRNLACLKSFFCSSCYFMMWIIAPTCIHYAVSCVLHNLIIAHSSWEKYSNNYIDPFLRSEKYSSSYNAVKCSFSYEYIEIDIFSWGSTQGFDYWIYALSMLGGSIDIFKFLTGW